MAELTAKEKALSKYARLRELLETGDYDKLDPEEEYAEAEEVEDELAGLRSWARKQHLHFVWSKEQGEWQLQEADEDTKATWQVESWLHRNGGLIGSFMRQDRHMEQGDDYATVDYTSILGMLPRKEESEPRTWLVGVQATADSGCGPSYPVDLYLTIRANAEGEPVVAKASDEQVKQVLGENIE
jgi:hypothetical protein